MKKALPISSARLKERMKGIRRDAQGLGRSKLTLMRSYQDGVQQAFSVIDQFDKALAKIK
jgi:hypothetical protein